MILDWSKMPLPPAIVTVDGIKYEEVVRALPGEGGFIEYLQRDHMNRVMIEDDGNASVILVHGWVIVKFGDEI